MSAHDFQADDVVDVRMTVYRADPGDDYVIVRLHEQAEKVGVRVSDLTFVSRPKTKDEIIAEKDAKIAELEARIAALKDGWIEWAGGECPVSPDTMVEYVTRLGFPNKWMARHFRWEHIGSSGDIMRYKVSS